MATLSLPVDVSAIWDNHECGVCEKECLYYIVDSLVVNDDGCIPVEPTDGGKQADFRTDQTFLEVSKAIKSRTSIFFLTLIRVFCQGIGTDGAFRVCEKVMPRICFAGMPIFDLGKNYQLFSGTVRTTFTVEFDP